MFPAAYREAKTEKSKVKVVNQSAALMERHSQNFIVSKKAIYDIGTKILFGSSVSHKPIKNWEIENVKVGFLKLSLPTIWLRYQNVI